MGGCEGIWPACLRLALPVTPTQVGTELGLEVLPRLAGRFLGPVVLERLQAAPASNDHLLPPVGELTNAVEFVASAQRVGKVVA